MSDTPVVTIVICNVDTNSLHELYTILLVLLSSYLNKTGKLCVYIKMYKNVLVRVHSHIQIPDTFCEFEKMMTYLRSNLKVKDTCNRTLLQVIKNNMDEYLVPNTYKIRLNVKGQLITTHDICDIVQHHTITCYINDTDEEGIRRVCDYRLNSIGVCGRLIGLIENALGL